ncbi:rCG25753, isoform CRA_a [Rattus norvegicus]|uniref:glutathione transferase n=1 Tax=Rattus norvegicus TaxID=10116 RepID=A6I1I3_RAT|nr:rCG25753, isoform CRA_a [Rattus norvegicus]
MEVKPKLYYFQGRGRMESIRWLLATAGVEFEEEFLETREQYEKLQKDGCLLFGQVPLVEIDGMLLTQTRAILSYLAAKYNLYGKDLKERVRHLRQESATFLQLRSSCNLEVRGSHLRMATMLTWSGPS